MKRDRTRITNRITGLLATVGIYVTVEPKLPTRLDRLMQWNGNPIPATLRERVVREWEKVALFTKQIQALERARRLELRQKADASMALVRRLLQLRGIGNQTAWLFVTRALRLAAVPQSPRSRRYDRHGRDAVPEWASQS